MKHLFALLIIYQFKHFFADYPLQGRYMLGKFKPWPSFIMPLLAHAGVHSLFTFAIAVFITPIKLALVLGAMDGIIHFIVDRIKASPSMLGRFKALSASEMKSILEDLEYHKRYPLSTTSISTYHTTMKRIRSNTLFWWCLGWDQMMHHLTHYLLIYIMLRYA